jgi:hypothetical protein
MASFQRIRLRNVNQALLTKKISEEAGISYNEAHRNLVHFKECIGDGKPKKIKRNKSDRKRNPSFENNNGLYSN